MQAALGLRVGSPPHYQGGRGHGHWRSDPASGTSTAATWGSATPPSCPPTPRSALDCVLYVEPIGAAGRKRASSAAAGSAAPSGGLGSSMAAGGPGVVRRPSGVRPHRHHGPGKPVRSDRRMETRRSRRTGAWRASAPERSARTTTARPAASAWRAPARLTGVDATRRHDRRRRPRRRRSASRRESAQSAPPSTAVSQTGTGVAAQGAIGVASEASGTAVQATATGGVASTAVSAAAAAGDRGPGVVERRPRARCALRGRRRPLRDRPPDGPGRLVGAGERRDGELRRAEPAEHRPRGRDGTERRLPRRARRSPTRAAASRR